MKIARSPCAALTLAFTGPLTGPAAGQVPTPPRACADWSSRVDLWVSPREFGMLAPRGRLKLLLGHDRAFAVASILSFPGDPSWDLLVREVGRDPLPFPPGGRFYLAPAGALDREGVLHLIWAEPDPGAGLEIFQKPVELSARRLLYASYRDGRWSPAEQIYEAQALDFYARNHSDLLVDEAGTLHFVFAASGARRVLMVHLRRDEHGWHATELREPGGPGIVPLGGLYPSLVLGPGRRLSLGFVGGAFDRAKPEGWKQQANSVFFWRSEDGGETWGAPVLVHLSGGRPATDLQLVRTRGDTLHMLWITREAQGSFATTGVAHTFSGDGGRTWSEPRSVPLPAGLEAPATIAAAAGPGGELHLVFSGPLLELNQQLWHTRFLNGWMPHPVRLLPDTPRRGSNFVFQVDGSGRQHLLWSHSALYREGDPPGARDVRLSYAVRPPCREDGT